MDKSNARDVQKRSKTVQKLPEFVQNCHISANSSLPSFPALSRLSDLASAHSKMAIACAKKKSTTTTPSTAPLSSRLRDLYDHLKRFDSLVAPKLGHIEVAMLVQVLLMSLPPPVRTTVVSVLYPSISHYQQWTEPRHLLYYYGIIRIVLAIIHQPKV